MVFSADYRVLIKLIKIKGRRKGIVQKKFIAEFSSKPDLGEAAGACVSQPDVDQLKSRLVEEWEHFHQVFNDEAIRQWRPRLRACIRAHGGH